jgi:hypothetical protein
MNTTSDFKQAMLKDMERKELSEGGLGKELGISQQAVHKWIDRGFPPMSRLADLKAILGADGEVARMTNEQIYGERVSRTPKLPAADAPSAAPAAPRSKFVAESELVKAYAARESEQFKAHLPPALEHNREIKFRPATLGLAGRIDYASDSLVVEISYAHGVMWSQSWSSSMLRLMLYRDVACPTARTVFLLVCADKDVRFPRLVTLASEKYGVELVRVASGAEAAAFIAEAEGEDLAEPYEPDDE